MSDKPLVSVLIPVYNRETMVKAALDSALGQSHENVEIVVVDNCSTDGSYEVMKGYAARDRRVRCYRNDSNIGAVRNWAACLGHSSGEYVQFLFSDDWLDPDAVAVHVRALAEHPEAGFSYSSVCIHAEGTGLETVKYHKAGDGAIAGTDFLRGYFTGLVPVPYSPGCALFRRKDVIENLAVTIPNRLGLDPAGKGFGPDLLLFLRSCAAHPKAFYVERPLCHFSGHAGSISLSHPWWFGLLSYDIAFAWFLATSEIPAALRRRFHALLFLRALGTSPFRPRCLRNPVLLYSRMFPEGYNCRSMDFVTWDTWATVRCSVAKRLENTRAFAVGSKGNSG